MKTKHVIIICATALICCAMISFSIFGLKDVNFAGEQNTAEQNTGRYEAVSTINGFYILIDTETGKCWARRSQDDSWSGQLPR